MKIKKKKVLMVLGGISGEREVSLETGRACFKALKKKGYKVVKFDPKKQPYNIISRYKSLTIFNALHGRHGEDGVAQSFFEYLGVPYTHSGVISSFNAMNKVISKKIYEKNKILSPNYFVFEKETFSKDELQKIIRKKKIQFPIVAKPVNEGSSIGVKICSNINELFISGKQLFKKYEELVFEPFIGGQEIQVAVINGFPIGAIELKPRRKFYDYKAKYSKAAKTEHIMPAKLNKSDYNKVLKIAKRAHKCLDCKGVTRSDFKFYKKKFYLLETNTQPGMTSLSLVPEIASYKGISFENLVEKILLNASINR